MGMRRRVRWGNVGRLAAGIAVLALVVMWPRLAGQAPAVPGGMVMPVVARGPGGGGVLRRAAAGGRGGAAPRDRPRRGTTGARGEAGSAPAPAARAVRRRRRRARRGPACDAAEVEARRHRLSPRPHRLSPEAPTAPAPPAWRPAARRADVVGARGRAARTEPAPTARADRRLREDCEFGFERVEPPAPRPPLATSGRSRPAPSCGCRRPARRSSCPDRATSRCP